jgi:AcrR family transcriptional regulator
MLFSVTDARLAPTLADDKRQATVDRVVTAARRLLGERGVDVTMDEIALAAGVGRRTVFRHFPSRDALLAVALRSGIRLYGEHIPSYDGGDWGDWLRALCLSVHRMHDSYGPGYWELTTRRDLPEEIAAAEASRRQLRRAAMDRFAATLWSSAGGIGATPAEVAAMVVSHLSVHFTVAVTADTDLTWRDAAELSRLAIASSVRAALEAGISGGGGSRDGGSGDGGPGAGPGLVG